MGSGHLVRCLTLAEELRRRGAEVGFLCREHAGHLCALVEARGFALTRLAMGPDSAADDAPGHAHWLGASWQQDAEQCRHALASLSTPVDWLVVDHYALDRRWDLAMRPCARRLLVIDDLADRDHDCDLLLDQNLVADLDRRYSRRLPPGCPTLLGPEYALLQADYAALHRTATPRRGPVRRVLAFFGGADPQGLAPRFRDAWSQVRPKGIEVDLVLPFDAPAWAPIDLPGLRLHRDLPTLAPLMAQADIAFGAGGASQWERLCLGLPAVVVATADNQRAIAEELQRRGLIRYLGSHEQVDAGRLAAALREVVAGVELEAWSRRCLATVDGLGAQRVAAVLGANAEDPLTVRPVRAEDEALLLRWANDPGTRANAFASEPISADGHRAWLAARLSSPDDCVMYVVEVAGAVPVGQVRFDRGARAWSIDYSIAPVFRGRGLGRPLLAAAIAALLEREPAARLVGEVKPGNLASRRVFESLGFASRSQAHAVEYVREPVDQRRSGQ